MKLPGLSKVILKKTLIVLHYYVKDQAYLYGLIGGYDYIVHVDGITKVFLDARGFIIPGACEYSADF